jgi:hypothetical protein
MRARGERVKIHHQAIAVSAAVLNGQPPRLGLEDDMDLTLDVGLIVK